jgi:2-dehydropantoate 2-reductase
MAEQNTPKYNVTIFGVGAMGTLFGSRLHKLANVTLVGRWPEQIATIRREGVLVTHPDGSQSRHFLRITNTLAGMPPADIALILVKSYQTQKAARQAAKILRPDGLALTLQNGLGNLELLSKAVGQQRSCLGITAQGATVTQPGHLHHAGEGPTHLAGGPSQLVQLQAVAELFNVAGIETSLADNADSLVWGKLAINAGINPLTALLDVKNGDLVENQILKRVMSAAATEVEQVAAAQGIRLPYASAADRTAEVSRATASNRSSMLQDLNRQAPTEIEAISGIVVQLGDKLGVPTPVNRLLFNLIKAKEGGALGLNRLARLASAISVGSEEAYAGL